jgi:hypothetical protein
MSIESLRMSIVRIAQAAKVETRRLPVLDASFEDLIEMCKKDEGWNELCSHIVEIVKIGMVVKREPLKEDDDDSPSIWSTIYDK